jgi:DNA gyrase subunit A
MIVEEDMVVTISNSGYIKRNPITLYQSQRQGGKGKTAMGTKEEDFVEQLFVASTHHTFLFLHQQGHGLLAQGLRNPPGRPSEPGQGRSSICSNLDKEEQLATVMAVPSFDPGYFIVMATRRAGEKDRYHGLQPAPGRRHHRPGSGAR